MSMIAGNLLGVSRESIVYRLEAIVEPPSPVRRQAFLDRQKITVKTRARLAFGTIMTLQGAWWIWSTILQASLGDQDGKSCAQQLT